MSSLEGEEKAALIVATKVGPILVSHAKNPKTIERESVPIFGFNWNKQLTIKVGSGAINDFPHRVKGESLSKGEITIVRHLSKCTFYAEVGPIALR